MAWALFDEGATLGTTGSEGGVIVVDDAHDAGARITLEKDAPHAPYAITCGVYGLFVHTRFVGDDATARADVDAMKAAIDALLALEEGDAVVAAVEAFVARFP